MFVGAKDLRAGSLFGKPGIRVGLVVDQVHMAVNNLNTVSHVFSTDGFVSLRDAMLLHDRNPFSEEREALAQVNKLQFAGADDFQVPRLGTRLPQFLSAVES
jgi:hypothetical protein